MGLLEITSSNNLVQSVAKLPYTWPAALLENCLWASNPGPVSPVQMPARSEIKGADAHGWKGAEAAPTTWPSD